MSERPISEIDRRATALHRIARALDLSPDALFGSAPAGEASDFLDLARFWAAIDSDQARRRVLNLAQQEARRSGYGEDA